jgi:hypothetical protein
MAQQFLYRADVAPRLQQVGGKAMSKRGVLTVRFTYRHGSFVFFGAGYWTRGLRLYEKADKVHK